MLLDKQLNNKIIAGMLVKSWYYLMTKHILYTLFAVRFIWGIKDILSSKIMPKFVKLEIRSKLRPLIS